MAADLPSTMRASQWSSVSGGIDKNLKYNTAAPLPKKAKDLPPNATLVKVAYSTPNPVDYKVIEGAPWILSKPGIPGFDYSGTVIKSNLAHLKPGEPVFGQTEMMNFGAFAEYALVYNKEAICPLPPHVPMKQAACIGITALTAYQTIIPFTKPGDKIFINGGSGGVGTFSIQIAKAHGLYVTTTCSGPNVELCKSLGADEVIDYRTENVVEALKRSGKQYDHAVDNIFPNADLYWNAHHYLKPSGQFVTIAGSPSLSFIWMALTVFLLPGWLGGGKRKFGFVTCTCNAEQYAQIAKWMEEGKVKAVIEEEYDLENADKAFERLKTGRTRGKIVVKVAGE